jgi:hypothetical protein
MFKENVIFTGYQITGNFFGKITKIPYAMLTSPQKDSIENVIESSFDLPLLNTCTSRGFERLLGFVEFTVLADAQINEVFEE